MKKKTLLFSTIPIFRIMKIYLMLVCVTLTKLMASNATAQNISLKVDNEQLKMVLKEIEAKSNYSFFYNSSLIDLDKKVSLDVKNEDLTDVLGILFNNSSISFSYLRDQIILFPKSNPEFKEKFEEILKKKELGGASSSPGDLKRFTIGLDQQVVTGRITDKGGLPLTGVTITEKGTSNGTVTDFDGTYSLKVSNRKAVLVISYIGFKKIEVEVGNQTKINLSLEELAVGLDEVVVIGFGKEKKANVTGAVSSVNFAEVLGERPVTNPFIALQGTMPGLEILNSYGEPGNEAVTFNIRGLNSLNPANPLVIVDNVPVDMFDLNPRDIESVTVLKDAAATSIYGARAAFGVILITTKKPKEGDIKFNYSFTSGTSSPTEIPEAASPREFVQALIDWNRSGDYLLGENPTVWLDYLKQYEKDPSKFPEGYVMDAGKRYRLKENDHVKDFFGDMGLLQVHNLSFGAANKKSAYRISLGYSDEDGIMITDQDRFKKYNVNAYVRSELLKNLTGELTTYYTDYTKFYPIANYSGIVQYPSFVEKGTRLVNGSEIPLTTPATILPYYSPNRRNDNNVRIFGKLNYNPIDGLNITGEYTFESRNRENILVTQSVESIDATTLNPLHYNAANTDYSNSRGNARYKATNLYASYIKQFNQNHNLSLLTGFNYEEESGSTLNGKKTNLVNQKVPAFSTAIGTLSVNDTFYEWAVMGFFGRMQYNYKEKYFMEANGRYDGSSRFTEGDRFGFFPSFSLGWNVANEDFLKDSRVISLLKFRGSWGEIGNQAISDPYAGFIGMRSFLGPWINNGTRNYTITTPGLLSPGFTWETVRTLNLGVDLSLFENRFNSSLEIYNRKTLDMIISDGLPVPSIIGTTAPPTNSADLESKGWELSLSWKDKINSFNYQVGFNLYDSQTEITKYKANSSKLVYNNYEGRKIGEIWGFVSDGYYTVDDFVPGTLKADLTGGTLLSGIPNWKGVSQNPGDVKYVDRNGDGIIFVGNWTLEDPGDQKVIGNNSRRYQFGINASADYKNFDISIYMNGVGKRDVVLDHDLFWPMITGQDNIFKHQLDYWRPDNTDAYYPRIYSTDNNLNYTINRRPQTKYLQDGKYLNIKNVTLGYSLPKTVLDDLGIQTLRLFFSGENLYMFDKMAKGLNPEFGNKSDGAAYPYMKKFSLGLNINF